MLLLSSMVQLSQTASLFLPLLPPSTPHCDGGGGDSNIAATSIAGAVLCHPMGQMVVNGVPVRGGAVDDSSGGDRGGSARAAIVAAAKHATMTMAKRQRRPTTWTVNHYLACTQILFNKDYCLGGFLQLCAAPKPMKVEEVICMGRRSRGMAAAGDAEYRIIVAVRCLGMEFASI